MLVRMPAQRHPETTEQEPTMPRKKKAKPAAASSAKTVSDASDDRQACAPDAVPGATADGTAEPTNENVNEPAAAPASPTGLPLYGCLKHVEAFKITETTSLTNGRVLLIGKDGTRVVGPDFVDTHRPRLGMYYLKDHGGAEYCVPAAEFERAYVRIDE